MPTGISLHSGQFIWGPPASKSLYGYLSVLQTSLVRRPMGVAVLETNYYEFSKFAKRENKCFDVLWPKVCWFGANCWEFHRWQGLWVHLHVWLGNNWKNIESNQENICGDLNWTEVGVMGFAWIYICVCFDTGTAGAVQKKKQEETLIKTSTISQQNQLFSLRELCLFADEGSSIFIGEFKLFGSSNGFEFYRFIKPFLLSKGPRISPMVVKM